MIRITLTLLLTVALTKNLPAGDGYEVSSKSGDKVVTYRVNFGGGKRFEQHTGFDPASKKFVYLSWTRGEPSPKPVSSIWDHKTGAIIDLYEFPNVKHPLPVIPSIDSMKACPMTGDKQFTHKRVLLYD